MNENGAPTPVAWTRVRAPQGSMAPTPAAEVEAAVAASPLLAQYGTPIDRESAREILTVRLNAALAAEEEAAAEAARAASEREAAAEYARQQKEMDAQLERDRRADERARSRREPSPRPRTRTRSTPSDADILSDVLRSRTTQTILRGVLEGVFGTRRRRR
jgi:hypothetical protein